MCLSDLIIQKVERLISKGYQLEELWLPYQVFNIEDFYFSWNREYLNSIDIGNYRKYFTDENREEFTKIHRYLEHHPRLIKNYWQRRCREKIKTEEEFNEWVNN